VKDEKKRKKGMHKLDQRERGSREWVLLARKWSALRKHESAESDQQSTCCFIGQKMNHNRPEDGQTSGVSSPILRFSNQLAMATNSKHKTMFCIMHGGPW